MELLTGARYYTTTEQQGWSKQEKIAAAWLASTTLDGDPYNPASYSTDLEPKDAKLLRNVVAGEKWIPKDDVTVLQITEKSLSIMGASSLVAEYYGSVLGAKRGVMNEIDAVDIESLGEQAAIDALNSIDITVIAAIGYAELVELGLIS